MKKNLATYLAMFALLFIGASCVHGDEEEVVQSPYALITTFSLNNITSSYHDFTSTGEDTVVVKTIATAAYPFTIDQTTGAIYNCDSLPFGTDVSKLVVNLGVMGVASIYVDSTDSYERFLSTDSIDFTKPRKLYIYSADAQYCKEYTVTVNVHTVNPDLWQWNEYVAPNEVSATCAVELNGDLCLFGTDNAGAQVVVTTPVAGEPEWTSIPVNGLPAAPACVQRFGGLLYAVVAGDLYVSADAVNWTVSCQGKGFVSIVGVSDEANEMWAATATELLCSVDGASFEVAGVLPESFPLYGLSLVSYPLSHNKNIIRNMLVGYDNQAMTGAPVVWSKLSNEQNWVRYNNAGNIYGCPSLKNLSVLRYDNFLYAFGNAGSAAGEDVGAFDTFFISKDNGIVWKPSGSFYLRFPETLKSNEAPFVSLVDSNNFIWIITAGENATVWKGIINRLGFKK